MRISDWSSDVCSSDLAAAKQANPGLRLIHLSTMSVFEPFAGKHFFTESAPLHPPKTDRYACEKVLAESALKKLPNAEKWQVHLRPTIVYGPYCGVWTDRILEAFTQIGSASCRERVCQYL